jgi:hypothetical protein
VNGKRWSIGPAWDEDGNEIPGMGMLRVSTPMGAGPRAVGVVMVTDELVADRRGLACAIRDARESAAHFRRSNPPPPWALDKQAKQV